MCEGVVDAVRRRADGRPVAAIGVRAGTLLRVKEEVFAEAFRTAAVGTVAADAIVDLEIVPLEATCSACGGDFATEDPLPACPNCGAVDVEYDGGDELTLVWLRYREEAPPRDPA